jgi:hypothetical protein
MLGKDARIARRIAVGAVALMAAAGLTAGPANAGQYSESKAQPFIEVRDVVSNVGQKPHLVVTYGNRGTRTLVNLSYGCWIQWTDGSVKDPTITHETYRSPLLPGQNANKEMQFRAVKRGKTKIRCSISGNEAGTGKERSAMAEAWIKVV